MTSKTLKIELSDEELRRFNMLKYKSGSANSKDFIKSLLALYVACSEKYREENISILINKILKVSF